MSDDATADAPVDDEDVSSQEAPLEEAPAEEISEEVEEPRDPLEVALERAEFAEKEIAYKEAEYRTFASE